MRHGVVGNRLNRTSSHRKAMLKNLATSVLIKGMEDEQMERHVVTTVPKAKAVRGLVERLITYAKKGDLSARRQAARFVPDPQALQALFETIGPRYQARQGGYTRVLKLSQNRHGDNAEMAIISLVEDDILQKPKKKPARKKAQPSKKVNITKSEGAETGSGSSATVAEDAQPVEKASEIEASKVDTEKGDAGEVEK